MLLKSIAFLYAAKKAKHIFWVSDSSYDGYYLHNPLKKKSSILYNIINVDSLFLKMKKDNSNYSYDLIYIGILMYGKDPLRLMREWKLFLEMDSSI